MSPSIGFPGPLIEWLRPLLERLLPTNPIKALQWLANLLDAVRRLRDKIGYHGTYEILDYDATLGIKDPQSKKAVLTRRQVVRFLQDNVVAFHDHSWGDGRLFAKYPCQLGVPVDFYEDGSMHNVLISLRETEDRGGVLEFWIERVIRNGFVEKAEWLEMEIDHLMRKLKLSIIFPKKRPCRGRRCPGEARARPPCSPRSTSPFYLMVGTSSPGKLAVLSCTIAIPSNGPGDLSPSLADLPPIWWA